MSWPPEKMGVVAGTVLFLALGTASGGAQPALCPDGQRSYFGICPDDPAARIPPVRTAPAATPAPTRQPASAPSAPRAPAATPRQVTYDDALALVQAQRYADALPIVRAFADKGHAPAQTLLGSFYSTGRGVIQNLQEAAVWFRKAADQGDAVGQKNLGLLYRRTPSGYPQAIFWLHKAADQGLASAQMLLGVMIASGYGVERDYAIAAQWYQRAANQGDAAAQRNLGVAYAEGWGVPRNRDLAIQWLKEAKKNGDDDADRQLSFLTDR